jgi:hypothetical protein
MRTMILERKPDDEILAVARAEFPKKKIRDHYPSWYRTEMVRKRGFTRNEVTARPK